MSGAGVRGPSSVGLWLAWLLVLAVLAALLSALAGVRWWVSVAVTVGAALVVAACTALLLRRPK